MLIWKKLSNYYNKGVVLKLPVFLVVQPPQHILTYMLDKLMHADARGRNIFIFSVNQR